MKNPVLAYLVMHKHAKNWRLRNSNHPVDPNWETGTYCLCHEKLRISPNAKKGLQIFDGIRIPGIKYPCLRSFFIVEKNINEKIHFTSYYFADKDPLEITPKIVSSIKSGMTRTNPGKILTKEDCNNLINAMKRHGFQKYTKRAKPESISTTDWNEMKHYAKIRLCKPISTCRKNHGCRVYPKKTKC